MARNYGPFSDYETATVQAVRAIQQRGGLMPSYDDIAEEMGVSKGTARYRVLRAISKGLVTMEHGKYRTIRLTSAASTVAEAKKKGRAA